MVYGDQGIFVSCAAYDASPGIGPQPLFEEVALVRALKRTRRFVAVPLSMTVSERRWQRDGLLRRTLRNRSLALAYVLGIDPVTLARWYRASRAREARPWVFAKRLGRACPATSGCSPRWEMHAATSSLTPFRSCGFTPARRAISPARSVWKARSPVTGAWGA